MRSDKIKKGLARAGNRALLYATGLTKGQINKPFIAVASSFTDIIPGHVHMRRLERSIEQGIASGEFHAGSIRATSLVVLTLFDGITLAMATGIWQHDWDEIVDAAEQLVLKGLGVTG